MWMHTVIEPACELGNGITFHMLMAPTDTMLRTSRMAVGDMTNQNFEGEEYVWNAYRREKMPAPTKSTTLTTARASGGRGTSSLSYERITKVRQLEKAVAMRRKSKEAPFHEYFSCEPKVRFWAPPLAIFLQISHNAADTASVA